MVDIEKANASSAACADGCHDYERCVIEVPEGAAGALAVGRYAVGDVCTRCGHIPPDSVEFRLYGVSGRMMRFAERGDYGEGLPVVELPGGWDAAAAGEAR